MSVATLTMLNERLDPLAIPKMALAEPRPRESRFGRPLALGKVHWVRPELVVESTYLGWTKDGLLRHKVFLGLREYKPARRPAREAIAKARAPRAMRSSHTCLGLSISVWKRPGESYAGARDRGARRAPLPKRRQEAQAP